MEFVKVMKWTFKLIRMGESIYFVDGIILLTKRTIIANIKFQVGLIYIHSAHSYTSFQINIVFCTPPRIYIYIHIKFSLSQLKLVFYLDLDFHLLWLPQTSAINNINFSFQLFFLPNEFLLKGTPNPTYILVIRYIHSNDIAMYILYTIQMIQIILWH